MCCIGAAWLGIFKGVGISVGYPHLSLQGPDTHRPIPTMHCIHGIGVVSQNATMFEVSEPLKLQVCHLLCTQDQRAIPYQAKWFSH